MMAWSAPSKVLLLASALSWLVYLLATALALLPHGSLPMVLAKGLPVSLLALAVLTLPGPRRTMVFITLVFYAMGDTLLEVPGGFVPGAASFALGHIIAAFWLLRFRTTITAGRGLVGAALIQLSLLVPVLFPTEVVPEALAMAYALTIALMTAALVISRFPRRAAWGGALFMASDTLIIMTTLGPVFGPPVDGVLVWSSYYAAVLLMVTGIIAGLAELDQQPA